MKDFNLLSGPWLGFSVQYGQRISEKILLRISDGYIEGTGIDKDGDFTITGVYHSDTEAVLLIREYTRTTEPSQGGVGIPYNYAGLWDGAIVSGQWGFQGDGGDFEMWPDLAEDEITLALEMEISKPDRTLATIDNRTIFQGEVGPGRVSERQVSNGSLSTFWRVTNGEQSPKRRLRYFRRAKNGRNRG